MIQNQKIGGEICQDKFKFLKDRRKLLKSIN